MATRAEIAQRTDDKKWEAATNLVRCGHELNKLLKTHDGLSPEVAEADKKWKLALKQYNKVRK